MRCSAQNAHGRQYGAGDPVWLALVSGGCGDPLDVRQRHAVNVVVLGSLRVAGAAARAMCALPVFGTRWT